MTWAFRYPELNFIVSETRITFTYLNRNFEYLCQKACAAHATCSVKTFGNCDESFCSDRVHCFRHVTNPQHLQAHIPQRQKVRCAEDGLAHQVPELFEMDCSGCHGGNARARCCLCECECTSLRVRNVRVYLVGQKGCVHTYTICMLLVTISAARDLSDRAKSIT